MRRRDLLLSGTLAMADSWMANALPGTAMRLPHKSLLGVYPYPASTNPSQGIAKINAWLGRSVNFVTTFVPYTSWSAFSSFVLPDMAGIAQFLSVPLTVTGTSLASVNSGRYDGQFLSVAKMLSEGGVSHIRFGWEFNGNWFPWSANAPGTSNAAAEYVNAYRRAVTIFRTISSSFRFAWCSNSPQGNGAGGLIDPSHCYPGDAYVDCIGQDVYFNLSAGTANPLDLFEFFKSAANFGMDWAARYATEHGKQLSIDEWGVNTDAFAILVPRMADWIRVSQVNYHSYWMSNADFKGDLSSNQYPDAGAAFIRKFGHAAKAGPRLL